MNPRIPDPQASPPTCDQCGNAVNVGYYDDWKERYYCDYICFERWAEDNYDAILDYYERMNLT